MTNDELLARAAEARKPEHLPAGLFIPSDSNVLAGDVLGVEPSGYLQPIANHVAAGIVGRTLVCGGL